MTPRRGTPFNVVLREWVFMYSTARGSKGYTPSIRSHRTVAMRLAALLTAALGFGAERSEKGRYGTRRGSQGQHRGVAVRCDAVRRGAERTVLTSYGDSRG